MAVPDIIPIVHEPDHHTGTIGHWKGGQFFGSVVAAFREGYTHTDDWPRHKRWYAVLHTFDDIPIRPFRHTFDGVLFGLVIETFEGEEHAEFHPDNIGFYEPWDGLYDT
ncbi:hypothetical protein ABZ815_02240 [Nonomuraea sp. NPDC047529]|uniref:hypothetical protein n=1 Tax=Nonomuraea sp. NPDC047529 TaxID=3155623 RepID=UPI0033C1F9DC